MKRRTVLLAIGSALGTAVLTPAASAADVNKIFRVGILSGNRRPSESVLLRALAERGYIEGRNTYYISRSADGEASRLPAMAAELVGLDLDVIVAVGGPAADSLKKTTQTIPIVLCGVGDPVGLGLITNVAHPGGNITGVTELSTELTAKRLQLLKEAVPSAARVAIMWNSTDRSTDLRAQEFAKTAPRLGVTMVSLPIQSADDIEAVLSTVSRDRPDAIVVVTDPITRRKEAATLDFLAAHGLASMYEYPESAKSGALLTYGPNLGELAPRAADYVDRILKGAKPGDLPLEGPNRYYLMVNGKTANRLGISLPEAILTRADEVIE